MFLTPKMEESRLAYQRMMRELTKMQLETRASTLEIYRRLERM